MVQGTLHRFWNLLELGSPSGAVTYYTGGDGELLEGDARGI